LTSGVILPAGTIRPAAGVLFVPLVKHRALLFASGLDDHGAAGRTLTIALVYGNTTDAEDDARALAHSLANEPLAGAPSRRFADFFRGLRVRADNRVIVITGSIAASQRSGVWRDLLERGDLAVLVHPGP